ncbi:MAG TPA: bifunctional phosphoribosyl-AMP cyclohydrolase/phosphoribosyl-ATP diphosphatase HisIE [Peptococcaceae bacterium]|jgi:phosphoribosyl-ATP pyrophosphohydrolase/phosphoribosyl-AMP cyclohydrolase|nr:bifunctional phosphoribosyl-AMP cyclohydrolase/phosphoribosyl-ATP diphosphatase HisIE [Clostridia bacterium]HOB82204.1 bifunctional phosphoribosyl-AMP cyclohydrolase/phosphoribosyl-ATP diphosphatase HisIE [Peptococcaceae bacterium]HPZ70921.1 bifunctional phosphoribosyl-AMP cyclohydrolase/phosphoribosyl-ATP diphosphatase HisIE [Peptococcaceae bacterium]HQD54105.1 bifunctional phosphoribosyl-AMP cyclohydrolase/phosphoribosyl-ATP diphosphatase HisIE [Peptococcaceae bacterium]
MSEGIGETPRAEKERTGTKITVSSPEQLALQYDERGLIPAIVQDVKSGTVLMLAYMNQESLEKTLAEGRTWFYSRSRQQLWAKGETSGCVQKVRGIYYDCDADTLLVQVEQTGVACHEGSFSCFSHPIMEKDGAVDLDWAVLAWLEDLIREREKERPEGSYTTYLFEKGIDKILKKVGEESTEVVIAAKGGKKEEIIYETADLFYHLLVMLRERKIELKEVWKELAARHKK